MSRFLTSLALMASVLVLLFGCKEKKSTQGTKPETRKTSPKTRTGAPLPRPQNRAKKANKIKPSWDLGRTQWTRDKRFKVSYTTTPAKIPQNDYFRITFTVLDSKGAPAAKVGLKADADMPEHRHGMKVLPKQKKRKPGVFEIQGFLFHMPGHWVIEVDVLDNGKKHRASFHVVL